MIANKERDDGATKVLEPARKNECMNRWAHSPVWMWESGTWTNKPRCTTCGEVWEAGARK